MPVQPVMFCFRMVSVGLLTNAEFLFGDDGAITVDVFAYQIVEQTAALTYHCLQGAGCCEVLVVVLKVLGEVFDAEREERNLALGAAGICGALSVSGEDLSLLFGR